MVRENVKFKDSSSSNSTRLTCIWKIFPLDIIIGELFLLPPTLHIHDTLDGGVAVLRVEGVEEMTRKECR